MSHLRLLALLALCGILPTYAQFDSGSVLGMVKDPSGLAIKGARVTLNSVDTGVQRTAETDESGNYEFLNVRIGPYSVSAEYEGFKKATSNEFRLTVGARQRVDLGLEVGTAAETVSVTAQVAALETETSSRGTVIGSEQTVNLPLNGRAYADLALLAPGVRRSGIADSRDASFNVNGMRSSQNNFVIDGVDNNSYGTSNQGFSNQVVQLSPDAVQEFRLETNNFSAEYGRAGGAVINATIRSGTNAFHGAVWEYLRNTKLNAVGFFRPATGKPDLIQNQFGGVIGGPIVKDKMFFFADYEGFRRVSKSVTFADVPTVEQRQGNLGIPIRNPYTGEIYADGRIPQNLITPWAREVLSLLPAPNAPGVSRNLQTLPRRSDQYD
ncbi:MAG TPA: carboxypeptidase regulatory-like domain-containing protein, partial [Bryobacteraceae bacterium]|nr:carboxypeptidase regulatory-like domain-containing protein [Bryobacteraceae bacterium]